MDAVEEPVAEHGYASMPQASSITLHSAPSQVASSVMLLEKLVWVVVRPDALMVKVTTASMPRPEPSSVLSTADSQVKFKLLNASALHV